MSAPASASSSPRSAAGGSGWGIRGPHCSYSDGPPSTCVRDCRRGALTYAAPLPSEIRSPPLPVKSGECRNGRASVPIDEWHSTRLAKNYRGHRDSCRMEPADVAPPEGLVLVQGGPYPQCKRSRERRRWAGAPPSGKLPKRTCVPPPLPAVPRAAPAPPAPAFRPSRKSRKLLKDPAGNLRVSLPSSYRLPTAFLPPSYPLPTLFLRSSCHLPAILLPSSYRLRPVLGTSPCRPAAVCLAPAYRHPTVALPTRYPASAAIVFP